MRCQVAMKQWEVFDSSHNLNHNIREAYSKSLLMSCPFAFKGHTEIAIRRLAICGAMVGR